MGPRSRKLTFGGSRSRSPRLQYGVGKQINKLEYTKPRFARGAWRRIRRNSTGNEEMKQTSFTFKPGSNEGG